MRFLASLLALVWLSVNALAAGTATPVAIVVTSCNTAGIFGPAGNSAPLTVDTAGNLCSSVSGSVGPLPDKAISGTASSATVLWSGDMSGYSAVAFQFTSVGSGNIFVFETSDDNTNWLQSNIASATSSAAIPTASITASLSNKFVGNKSGRYARIRISTYGSGTITLVGNLISNVWPYTSTYSSGLSADGAVVSGNPVTVAGIYQSTLPTYSDGQTARLHTGARGSLHTEIWGQDTVVAAQVGQVTNDNFGSVAALDTNTYNLLFNGSNWSRWRQGGPGSGLVEVGPYSFGRATADTQIKGSAGFVHTISVAPTTATPTAGLVTVYDSTTETGTAIYSEWIFATDVGHTITLDVPTTNGIYVGYDATLANASVTVSYR